MKQLITTHRYLLIGIVFLAVTLACRAVLGPGSSSKDESSENVGGNTVNVIVKDFSFSLNTTQAEAGTITFAVKNDGSMRHDFAIRGNGVEKKTTKIRSGESATLVVDLEPGSYTYICTISGHDKLGMSGTFTVTSN